MLPCDNVLTFVGALLWYAVLQSLPAEVFSPMWSIKQ